MIPGALHLPRLDHPDAVTAAMLGFVTTRDADLAAAGARVRRER